MSSLSWSPNDAATFDRVLHDMNGLNCRVLVCPSDSWEHWALHRELDLLRAGPGRELW
jgi:hypothetical protein